MDDLGQIKTLHDHRCLDYDLSFVQVAAEVKEERTAALERVRAKVAAAPSPAPTPAISPVTHAKEEDSHAGDAAATPTLRSVCELNPWEPTAEECEHYATTYSC